MTVFVTGGSGFAGGYIVRRLIREGHTVRGLARSETSARKIAALGAEPVYGDLHDREAMAEGMAGCSAVVHSAAKIEMWGPAPDFQRINVDGTRTVLDAARAVGVEAFVQIGAGAVIMDKAEPILDADETWPLQFPKYAPYIATKALSEQMVREASGPGFRTCVVRPPAIWGKGDLFSDLLPTRVRQGMFGLIGGGEFPYVTCHAENVAEGALCALDHGRAGEAYFINDPEPITAKAFILSILEAMDVDAKRLPSFPYPVAAAVGAMMEGVWSVLPLPGEPPLTRMAARLLGQPFTTSDRKAREELGYVGHMTRSDGLAGYR